MNRITSGGFCTVNFVRLESLCVHFLWPTLNSGSVGWSRFRVKLLLTLSELSAMVEYSSVLLRPRTQGPPTINAEIQTSTQAWKLIEQDYTLRLSLVAHEWATEHLRAWNAVFAEGRKRGNAAYCGPALVEMEIADADKRAEWS